MNVMAYFLVVYINGEVVEALSIRNQHTEVQLTVDASNLDKEARDFVNSRMGWRIIYNGDDGKDYFTTLAEAGDLVRTEGNLQISYEYRTVEVD